MNSAPSAAKTLGSRDLLTAGLLALATAIVFARAVRGEFIELDDGEYVLFNPWVNPGFTAEFWRRVWTAPVAANWHPLTIISHALDCQLFGLAPWGHHLSNVLLHAATAGLMYLAWRRLGLSLGVALAAVTLWAWHPLRVESVAWIAERKDVLSGLLWAGSLWAYGAHHARPGRWSYGRLCLLFGLGLAAKPSLVTLPCVLLLLDVWPLGRRQIPGDLRPAKWPFWAPLVREKLPLFGMTLVSCGLTWWYQRTSGAEHVDFPVASRLANSLYSIWSYVGQMLWPEPLYLPYLLTERTTTVLGTTLGAAGLIASLAMALLCARRWPWLLVGWCWYLGVLVPMIGLVQVGYQSMADRYSYLPQMGLWLLVAGSLGALVRRWAALRAAVAAGGVLLALLLAGLTFRQLGFWESSQGLFEHTLRHAPTNYLAHVAVGRASLRQGQDDRAEREFRAALNSEAAGGDAHFGLGQLAMRRNHYYQAIYHFERARTTPAALAFYAEALSLVGRIDRARAAYQAALAREPLLVTATGSLAEGIARGERGHEVVSFWSQALEKSPDDVVLLDNLAWFLATHADDKLRDPDRALRLALRGARLTDEADPVMLDTLAAAQAATRQFVAAARTAQRAIELARAQPPNGPDDTTWSDFAAQIEKRRALYQARQPTRETPGTSPRPSVRAGTPEAGADRAA